MPVRIHIDKKEQPLDTDALQAICDRIVAKVEALESCKLAPAITPGEDYWRVSWVPVRGWGEREVDVWANGEIFYTEYRVIDAITEAELVKALKLDAETMGRA